MANIEKTQVIKQLGDDLRLSQTAGAIPRKIGETIVPTFNAEYKYPNFVYSQTRNTSGSSTMYTVPNNRIAYLYFAQISYECDTTCDSTLFYIKANIDGASTSRDILSFTRQGASTRITGGSETFNPSMPLKLKAGDSIIIGGSYTVGTARVGFSIVLFEDDGF